MRILIAEDERRLAGAIARGLRREGMAVDVTHDGASALIKARVVPYDVVVLDRDLPELHGDEVCRRLSEGDERETKVLMLTAADSLDDVVDGLASAPTTTCPSPSSGRSSWPVSGRSPAVPAARALPSCAAATSSSTPPGGASHAPATSST